MSHTPGIQGGVSQAGWEDAVVRLAFSLWLSTRLSESVITVGAVGTKVCDMLTAGTVAER